ncbi:MAG: hypothetical protein K8S62_11905 [Candidatus Sabulitectum sp.]|nr:hypothetical protein [Candidatus Sabulitectum sp.]
MTVAEIHGKIASSGSNISDRLEDLLTSDVFGTCKYLRDELLLFPFLSTAISVPTKKAFDLLPLDISISEYSFWPRLSRSEPDLLLHLQSESDNDLLVMIEAKYLSGKSGKAYSDDELTTANTSRDQLARQLEDLCDFSARENIFKIDKPHRCLFYVTAHRHCPSDSILEAINEFECIRQTAIVPNVYWTSWVKLYDIALSSLREKINLRERALLSDICLLLKRKGLVKFSGFASITSVSFLRTHTLTSVTSW